MNEKKCKVLAAEIRLETLRVIHLTLFASGQ